MVKLHAPPGVCSATFGDKSYQVVNGCVTVPDEAVATLTGIWHKFTREPNAMEVGANPDRPILKLHKR